MADEDENVRMPVDDQDDVDLGRDENEFMDDSGEEESDEEMRHLKRRLRQVRRRTRKQPSSRSRCRCS